MNQLKFGRIVASITILALILTFCTVPTPAFALQVEDRSGELPGMADESPGSLNLLIGIVAALTVVLVVVKIAKTSSDKKVGKKSLPVHNEMVAFDQSQNTNQNFDYFPVREQNMNSRMADFSLHF